MSEAKGGPEKLPWDDVVAQQEFLAPAGVGLAVLAGAFFFESPYAWILLFAYFLIVLPGAALYVRTSIKPTPDDDPAAKDAEDELGLRVRTALEHLTSSKNIEESQVGRALEQYKALDSARREMKKHLRSLPESDDDAEVEEEADDPYVRAVGWNDTTFRAGANNLHACSVLFAKLDAIDSSQLMKRLQSSRPGPELDECKELAAKRDKMIAQVVDRLASGERLSSQYLRLAREEMNIELRLRYLRELAEKLTQ